MKKIIVIALVAILSVVSVFAQAAAETQSSTTKIVVGATPEPHAALLSLVVDDLAAQGITLEIKEFTDYVTPNDAVEYGEIDANYFQHIPYLESFNTEHGYHLVNAGGIHVEPIALYSSKYSSLSDLPNGAVIAIPNDPTNEGRALLLLQSAGLIKLKEGVGMKATPADVVENPKNLKFQELEAAQLPRSLADVDASVITMNYVMSSGLSPKDQGIFLEDKDTPLAVMIIAAREKDKDQPAYQKFVKYYQSESVKKFIAEKYKGTIVPAWE